MRLNQHNVKQLQEHLKKPPNNKRDMSRSIELVASTKRASASSHRADCHAVTHTRTSHSSAASAVRRTRTAVVLTDWMNLKTQSVYPNATTKHFASPLDQFFLWLCRRRSQCGTRCHAPVKFCSHSSISQDKLWAAAIILQHSLVVPAM